MTTELKGTGRQLTDSQSHTTSLGTRHDLRGRHATQKPKNTARQSIRATPKYSTGASSRIQITWQRGRRGRRLRISRVRPARRRALSQAGKVGPQSDMRRSRSREVGPPPAPAAPPGLSGGCGGGCTGHRVSGERGRRVTHGQRAGLQTDSDDGTHNVANSRRCALLNKVDTRHRL